MKSRWVSLLVATFFGISSSFGMSQGVNITIRLSFDSDPQCLIDGKKPTDKMAKGSKAYDEASISWSTGCEVLFPKGVSHCVLIGQGISNPDAISQWSVFASDRKIMARMTSEADINPDFGKLDARYFCH